MFRRLLHQSLITFITDYWITNNASSKLTSEADAAGFSEDFTTQSTSQQFSLKNGIKGKV